jgi:hypothetical protein
MPNKVWDKLKDKTNRSSAGEWAQALGISDLTSNEWRKAGEMGPNYSDAQIRDAILADRKRSR